MAMIDSLVVRRFHVNPRAAAAAIVAYWIGTPFAYYFFREPLMVHVVSAFWVASILSVGLAMTDGVRRWHPLALTLAISMALVCRPSNVFIAPFLVYVAVELRRRRLLADVIRFLPLATLGLVPLFLQLLTWRLLSGHWLNYGYRVSFHWSKPMLLQTLVSPRHGLFVWSPLLVLAAGGAAWATFRRARLSGTLLPLHPGTRPVLRPGPNVGTYNTPISDDLDPREHRLQHDADGALHCRGDLSGGTSLLNGPVRNEPQRRSAAPPLRAMPLSRIIPRGAAACAQAR